MKIYQHDDGHMTKMAAMSIYGKNPSKTSDTGGPISTKLGMYHRRLLPIGINDPGLTLTHLTARSNFVT